MGKYSSSWATEPLRKHIRTTQRKREIPNFDSPSIHDFVEKERRGKTQKFLCVRGTIRPHEELTALPGRVGEQQQLRGRKISVSEVCMKVFPSILKSTTVSGVCVEAWTDSPATPLPKQLTAITFPSCQQKLLNGGSWNKTKEDDT